MRKIIVLFICFMAMVCLSSCSNAIASNNSLSSEEEEVKINEWYDIDYEADELKREKAYTAHCYRNNDGEFFMDDDINSPVVIYTFDGIFDTKYICGQRMAENSIIGLYDKNGKLLEKFVNIQMVITNSGCAGVKNKKIKDFIRNKQGYVRFVISRYARSDFDMKIPCMNN